MAAQGTLGLLTAIDMDEASVKLRPVHRILGFVIVGAGLWLGVANSIDGAEASRQVAAYSYGALATVPIVMFSF
jgi:hypothetical protein